MKQHSVIFRMERRRRAAGAAALVAAMFLLSSVIVAAGRLPSLDEALASKQDVWGLAAMRQTNGPSYEFFTNLLPPLRYVNAQFRHYPIVLSAPGAMRKARLVSNGSAVNAKAALGTWKEVGVPVDFFLGDNAAPFGQDLKSLDGPRYEKGYLPIVQLEYRAGAMWRQESFASVDPSLASNAVVFMRFTLADRERSSVAARLHPPKPLRAEGCMLVDEQGRAWVSFDARWQWNAEKQTLTASLRSDQSADIAFGTAAVAKNEPSFDAAHFNEQKKKCIVEWESVLARAMHVETPEPVVNDAWKATIIGSFMLLRGDHMNYSAGNAYEVMYEAESGDNVRALAMWGLTNDARRMIPPLLDYGVNPGLKFHDAAFKLQLLTHYFWLARDVDFVRRERARWQKCVEILLAERDAATGLLPRESYCGDIHDKVFSLNSNANAWRGLHDASLLFEALGERDEARRAFEAAAKLREAILAAVAKSERRDVQPAFMPIALLGEEKPYDVLTASKLGSYWDLMIPYVIGSGLFADDERETAMIRYLEEHGGLCMGMIRFHQHSGLFANEDGLDDLYGLRFVDALLRRDETDRALVSFYGKLAQGMTRDTFLSAEGTGLKPLDEFGRPMYLPPTCSGDALYLWTLRSLLVQDYDFDHDGRPETLRLLFATPRRWLENGKTINVERATTAFGEVSVRVESKLNRGEVVARVDLPQRNVAAKTLLRIRVPEGWRVVSAKCGAQSFDVDASGATDISTLRSRQTIHFKVKKVR